LPPSLSSPPRAPRPLTRPAPLWSTLFNIMQILRAQSSCRPCVPAGASIPNRRMNSNNLRPGSKA
jgi:hypothetical protein